MHRCHAYSPRKIRRYYYLKPNILFKSYMSHGHCQDVLLVINLIAKVANEFLLKSLCGLSMT